MAMSLEDLLTEEGFKRRKAKMKPRISSASEGRSMSLYTQRDKHEFGSLLAVKKTERTRSDIPRYGSNTELSMSSSFTGRKPRDNFIMREKIGMESDKGTSVEIGHRDSRDAKRFSISSSGNLRGSEITEVIQGDEIVELEMNRPYKDIYSNKVYYHEEMERHIDNKKNRNNSFNHAQTSFRDTNRGSMKQPQSFGNRSNLISESNRNFDESRSMRQTKLDEALEAPALDEAAVKAIISILSGHARQFIKDEEFRTSLHHNSFASLNLIGLINTESKVLESLEKAIEVVERAAEESATLKELKRASLQLSVITGLNSNDLRDRFTSGIPNFKLSACAHLYLGVIYMLQKKDGISAKHILQVFSDSPFQARTVLLPDLWDLVFLPHFQNLKLWYERESYSLTGSPILANRKVLEKLYNETLDLGTYRFAVYYKDWITEGVEAPSLPLIKIPSFSAQLMPRGGLHGHASSPVSPQAMVSKKLYDEVFRHSHKKEIYEEHKFDVSGGSSNSPAAEDKQLILYDSVTCTNQKFEPDGESLSDTLPAAEEVWRSHPESSSGVSNLDEKERSCQWLQALSPAKENEISLDKSENPVFELKQIEQPLHKSRFSPYREDATHNTALVSAPEHPFQEQQGNYEEDFKEKLSLSSIPTDFLCPLTGLLFQDPVTLETGQSFERQAITEWFSKGFITCPVTRKTLQSKIVPPTNLILKRVIAKWKKDHFEHLLVLLSRVASEGPNADIGVNDDMIICILQKLLTVFGKDERVVNARAIMSFGGMHFLVRRFHQENSQEKTFILQFLSYCIEADGGCRNDIARNINRSSLLEMLRSDWPESRTNTVLLLTELICLNRRNKAERFLEGIKDEEIINAMDHLLIYLKTCPLEQTPLVAVLLLHLDLLSERHTRTIYRQEAVDALTVALKRSLSDESVQKKCCRALLILGGFFSSSGKLMTEDWILRLSGFLNGPDWDIVDHNEANNTTFDATVTTVSVCSSAPNGVKCAWK